MVNLLKNAKIETVEQIYLGVDKACRCGRKGNYTNPEYNPKKAKSRLKKAISLVDSGAAEIENLGACINISYGANRAITIYFKRDVNPLI